MIASVPRFFYSKEKSPHPPPPPEAYILFLVDDMPDVVFVASPALIHRISLCLEFRVLLQELPRIILRLVSLLCFPGALLACVVFGVRLEWRNLVEILVSVVAHVLFISIFLLQLA